MSTRQGFQDTPTDQPEDVLRRYWHPVAQTEELRDAPLPVRLLGQPLVVWRSGSDLGVFYDLCVHRGAPLSLGHLDDGQLVCGFHGWHYDVTGRCTRIPSRPPDRPIPARARATAYRAAERYGLIWVCAGEPDAGIPSFPAEFDDPAFRWDRVVASDVRANAARFMENSMDLSHFAWVHAGVLASRPEVDPIVVRPCADGFSYDVELPGERSGPPGARPRSRYRLVVPFTLFIEKYTPGSADRQVLVFLCSPLSSNETRVFRLGGRNFRRLSDEQEFERAQLIFEQDRVFVEAQRPQELPLDLREELHVRGPDTGAIEYRRLLASVGVDWS